MPNYNPKTKHLESTKHKAEDTHGKTQTLGVRLDPSDVEALKQLPGGVSANIGMKIFKKYFNRYTDKNPTHYILYYERNDIRDGFDPFSYTNDYNVPKI